MRRRRPGRGAPPQARQSAPPQARQGGSRATENRQYQTAQPRAYESRPLPTAPQATPRTNENRLYSGAQTMPRGNTAPLYSAAQPPANMNRPNQAQPRGDSRAYGQGSNQAQPRGNPSPLYSAAQPPANMNRSNQAQPRGDSRTYGQGSNQAQPRGDSRTYGQGSNQAQPRGDASPLYSAAQRSASMNRPNQAQPRVEQRTYGGTPNNGRGSGSDQRATYRYPPNYGHPNSYYARPYHSRAYVRPPHYAPYRPYYFGHSYYSFRPYWNIGFGLWVGYTVPYPYTYFYAGYAPRVYGTYYSTTNYYSGSDYYGIEPYMAKPAVSVYGGVSFDIQPSDADLFIDGEFVGTVGTFSPTGEPLTLTPGEHRIAIQRNGYRPMEWDVTIEPGQVIPYRGVMERY